MGPSRSVGQGPRHWVMSKARYMVGVNPVWGRSLRLGRTGFL